MVSTVAERKEAPVRQGMPPARPPAQRNPRTSMVVGVLEMIAGVLVIPFSFVIGLLATAVLGVALGVAGVLQIVEGSNNRAPLRVAAGVLGILAAIFVFANPGIALTLVGIYLVVSGIMQLSNARKLGESSASGIIQIVLGALALTGVFSLGVLVGLFLIVMGYFTYRAGARALKAGY